MLTLTLFPPSWGRPASALVRQVEAARWESRYRFFTDANSFPADTDCTGLALSALHEHGRLSSADLKVSVHDLLRSAAECSLPRRDSRADDALHPGVPMVYWEDGREPRTLNRGRKHDAVACANALYAIHLADPQTLTGAQTVISASMRYLTDHLTSRRYLDGTRYYPSPDAFLYAASRLCARFPSSTHALTGHLRRAWQEREEYADTQAAPESGPGMPLDLALRMLTAGNLALTTGQDQRRRLLARAQRPDGSWAACPYYRMGRFPVFFGSSYLTTLFCLRALTTPESATVTRPRQAQWNGDR
ncbi:hypothetical protein [Streptomyces sp. NBC_01244]|uniref:hypothetical protein n=1 Tax=Streptomyces sp. NBC_01244 TaxID=2903797 RepID=UPI002E133FF2|nr:hypothetical protein OG247_34205 [Streptomyces sp. NBC_01244]